MRQRAPDILFDAASLLRLGRREVQEDSLDGEFLPGSGRGLAVLADGLGGHAAGEVASRLVVAEVLAGLRRAGPALRRHARRSLLSAAETANRRLADHAAAHAGTGGMGSTLVAVALTRDRLHWLSVGDSPLWLWRGGRLRRLNEVHSLAPQLDFLARTGRMEAEAARRHPDRDVLTSCLSGRPLGRIDCPEAPLALQAGDVILLASDGILPLGEARIAAILAEGARRGAAQTAAALAEAVAAADDPAQDNLSLMVIRPLAAPAGIRRGRQPWAEGWGPALWRRWQDIVRLPRGSGRTGGTT